MDALRAAARRGPPSLTPRRLAAARAALVRSLIAPRSCSATAARMWTVSLLACGLSAAMNSTLLSMSGNERQIAGQAVELGDDELALVLPAGRQGLFKLGAGVALAALDLGMLGDQLPGAAVEVVHDGLTLGVEAEAGFPLLVRGHPVISNKPAKMRGHEVLLSRPARTAY